MTNEIETLRQLRQAILDTPAMHQRLQGIRDLESLEALFVEIADQRGWQIDLKQLRPHLEASMPSAAPEAISDQQLDAVAGGLNPDEFYAASAFSLWIACAVMSSNNEQITIGGKQYGSHFDLQWC